MTRKEAIKILRDVHDKALFSVRNALETLIPEFRESEDERIRKWLIHEIEVIYVTDGRVNNENADKALAWLERQKELPLTDEAFKEQLERVLRNNVLDVDIRITGDTVIGAIKNLDREIPEWNDNFEEAVADLIERAKQGKCDSLSPIEEGNKLLAIAKHGKVNQQEWSEKDKKMLEVCSQYIGNTIPADYDEEEFTVKDCRNWLKSLPERFSLQSKQEWNEEDKKALQGVTEVFMNYGVNIVNYPAFVHWLKDLPNRINLQPKQEWSDEDERMRNQLIYDVEYHRKEALFSAKQNKATEALYNGIKECYDEKIAWLKALRSSWKPSEEQMGALKAAMDRNDSIGYNLRQFYEQFKKL